MARYAPKLAAALVVGLLLAGGSYLYAVRGTAMLMDLSTSVRGLLCL